MGLQAGWAVCGLLACSALGPSLVLQEEESLGMLGNFPGSGAALEGEGLRKQSGVRRQGAGSEVL